MATQEGPGQLWSVINIAEAANLTPQRVRQMLAMGRIAGFKVGRDWVVQREEALRFLSAHGKHKKTKEAEQP